MKTIVLASLLLASSFASAASKFCEDIAVSLKVSALEGDRRSALVRVGKICVDMTEVKDQESQRQLGTIRVTVENIAGKHLSTYVMHAAEGDAGMGKTFLTLAKSAADLDADTDDSSPKKIVFERLNDNSQVRKGQPHGTVSIFGQEFKSLKK